MEENVNEANEAKEARGVSQATQAPKNKVLALIDGANLLHRSYHAMKHMKNDLTAPDGTKTAALMGFVNQVSKVKTLAGADALAIVFESPTGTFRDDLFEGYKANRPETPSELKIQFGLAEELFPLMGVPVIRKSGFEADDLLSAYGILGSRLPGWDFVLATSDKDVSQAIGERTKVLDPNGWQLLGPEEVRKKHHGVGPELIAEFLALQGDGVDNIPGVDKCGPKTAAKLLLMHGSVEEIYKHVDEMTPALKKGFEAARDNIPKLLSLTRANLDCGMPMSPDEIHSANRSPDWASALVILKRLNFSKLVAKAEKGLAAMEAREERLRSAPRP